MNHNRLEASNAEEDETRITPMTVVRGLHQTIDQMTHKKDPIEVLPLMCQIMNEFFG